KPLKLYTKPKYNFWGSVHTLENWRLPHDDIIKVSPQEYLLIFKSNQHRGETEREIKTFIEKSSDEYIQEHSLITIGTFESGIRGLVQSHSNCKHLKLLLDEMNITIGVFCYLDYELEVICHTIQDTPFLNQYSLISNYERIIHFGEDNYLGETLEAYFNNHGKLLKTANDLFIHRNTLNYRLKKIHEITKWDPHTVDGIVLLRLAQILYQHQH
ncbi:helix-turn-helix domain-containing protein, partial [Staphylococcus felis]|uniref:PucR family transcriptional regulator n=1 Tax=Staphylococcus felis TaxID=46127 RepID=UPI0025A44346